MIEIKSITTLSQFNEDIQQMVKQHDMNYLDAIIAWCEEKNIDVEQVVPLIRKSSVIKAKLENDASDLNLLESTPKLPI